MIWTLIFFGLFAVCGYIWNRLVTEQKDEKRRVPVGCKFIAIIACILMFILASFLAKPFLPSDEEDAAIDYYYDPN